MSRKETTSAISNNGEEDYKCLLPKGVNIEIKNIDKLKAKAIKALCRKIFKEKEEDKEADFPYHEFLPHGLTGKREIFRFVSKTMKNKVYEFLEVPVRHNLKWDSEAILDLVLHATIRDSCVEDCANSFNLRKPREIGNTGILVESVPNGDTVLRRIQKVKTTEWMERFERANKQLLKEIVKARVLTGFVWLALDITPVPYYGDINCAGVMGSKKVKGTNYAFKYMTVCVSAQKEHVTLAGSYMTQLMNSHEMMKELIEKSSRYVHGKIGILCDREFWTCGYIGILEELGVKYLMPAKKNSKVKRIIKETTEFPRVVRYPMGRGEKKVEFNLILVESIKKGKDGKRKKKVHAFATNVGVTEDNCEVLVELYRKRWAIETSYSMLSEVRARTSSKSFAYRWFLVLFGLLVRNGYYLFNEIVVYTGHVTLKTFAELISEISMVCGTVDGSKTRKKDG
ncbi:MAG: transposase [Candidatus Methanofastidiosia archaeon]|jgi:hypothetical protein